MTLRDATILVDTGEGAMRVHVSRPAGSVAAPGVVMYMDAVGFREELRELARGVARRGYSCWLPDLYYLDGGPSFDPHTPRADFEKFAPLMRRITRETVLRDTRALLREMSRDAGVAAGPKGCVGFCMGGRLAMWAAGAFPEAFAAAASLHGGRLGTEEPDSPHRYAKDMRCEAYLGFASDDPLVPPEHIATIESALRRAGIRFESEIHAGTQHGYMFPQRFCHHAGAARASWDKVFALFDRTIGAARALSEV